MPTAVVRLPQRQRRVALADALKPGRQVAGRRVSEGELEGLLSGGRAVGRARVGCPPQLDDDVLVAVLAGLRAL
ncbi:hypothetical protein QTQ03_24055 [Micromonospora sp. WMMA1363]|uniref:hypothetical protein n=1 Tax=Micromonospora sp. WMMA1363 TaxID=3053985 RepID=UPI00259CC756|nr:hypothetical protein [Micromonospora sp. WMMA1363]MDM4722514.1 hypothetical protein [Micromonospora sp. WMMA1363]